MRCFLNCILPVVVILFLSACAESRTLHMAPPGETSGDSVEVFVATNRKSISDPDQILRSPDTRLLRVEARIPPIREVGMLSLPRGIVDPDRDFLANRVTEYPSDSTFLQDIRSRLASIPSEDREITLYVHGYNNTFAKGVMRIAQLDHDLESAGILVHFSWPSAGTALGYAYDRDSVLFSRDALAEFLKSLAATGGRIVLVAHSMGAHLAMESLRQIEILSPGWSSGNLSGAILLSPDIDVDVFRSQVAAIQELPQPFVIFVSDQDRVLALSSLISQSEGRLGRLTDPAEISDLKVTVLDVSSFSTGLGHFSVSSSSALIRILQRLSQVDASFSGEGSAAATFPEGVVLTVQNVTSIILSPLANAN